MKDGKDAVANQRALFRLDRLRELKEQKAMILEQRTDLVKKLSVAVFANPSAEALFDPNKDTKFLYYQAGLIRTYAELAFPCPDDAEEKEIRRLVMGLDG